MKRIISSAIGMPAFACWSTSSQALISSFVVTDAKVSKSIGAVTVSGTIECTAGHTVVIFDNVIQIKGPNIGATAGATVGPCSGGTDPWTDTNISFFGPVKPGNASVIAGANDIDDLSVTPTTTTKVSVHPAP